MLCSAASAPQPLDTPTCLPPSQCVLSDKRFRMPSPNLARFHSMPRNVYPINKYIKHVYRSLKASDAVVYQSVRALGFEPMLYVYYEYDQLQGMIIDKVIDFQEAGSEDDRTEFFDIVHREGGIFVTRGEVESDEQYGTPELVKWATPLTEFNRREDPASAQMQVCRHLPGILGSQVAP